MIGSRLASCNRRTQSHRVPAGLVDQRHRPVSSAVLVHQLGVDDFRRDLDRRARSQLREPLLGQAVVLPGGCSRSSRSRCRSGERCGRDAHRCTSDVVVGQVNQSRRATENEHGQAGDERGDLPRARPSCQRPSSGGRRPGRSCPAAARRTSTTSRTGAPVRAGVVEPHAHARTRRRPPCPAAA